MGVNASEILIPLLLERQKHESFGWFEASLVILVLLASMALWLAIEYWTGRALRRLGHSLLNRVRREFDRANRR